MIVQHLDVTFSDKKIANFAGAKWDKEAKMWWCTKLLYKLCDTL